MGTVQESESVMASMAQAAPQKLSSGQREEAWLKQVTERQMRRMHAGAGYNPDVNTGTRNRKSIPYHRPPNNHRPPKVLLSSRTLKAKRREESRTGN